ncbi:MAG: hypoxanthine phosphoribosyltransferase [Thermoleophilia bacterium]|nr:hypoxanthine phosphoribosyltransferase [Thermoleophilia bacterium]
MIPHHPALVDQVLSREQIAARVSELGAEISEVYAGRELKLTCVLKGGFIFLADLVRAITIPCAIDFMVISSYGSGTQSSGIVRILKDLDAPIEGLDVLVVEDIVDSGLTLSYLLRNLETRRPATLEVCTLLAKPARHENDVPCRFVGFEIPNTFVVGYGLDAAERFRELPDIWSVDDSKL